MEKMDFYVLIYSEVIFVSHSQEAIPCMFPPFAHMFPHVPSTVSTVSYFLFLLPISYFRSYNFHWFWGGMEFLAWI